MNRSYVTSPADALQLLSEILTTTERIRPLLSQSGLPVPYPYQRKEMWDDLLRDVPVYFFTRNTADLILAASHSYPLDDSVLYFDDIAAKLAAHQQPTLPQWLPEIRHGLAVFDAPVISVEIDGEAVGLTAVLWATAVWHKTNTMTLLLRGITRTGAFAQPVFWHDSPLSPTSVEHDLNNTGDAEATLIKKWICTAGIFIRQQIVASSSTRVGKHIARRIPQHTPSINVITLRRAATTEQPRVSNSIEWAHRWIVNGHWRNQYYPSTHTRRPIWIHPHVKGPDDKPFAEPKQTVYKVTR